MVGAGQARFIKQRWPEGMVVFDTLTGDTHAMATQLADWFDSCLLDPQLLALAPPAEFGLSEEAIAPLRRLLAHLDLTPHA